MEHNRSFKFTDRCSYVLTNKPSLKIFSGDIFFPSLISNILEGKQFNLFLRKLDLDYAILGKNDFLFR